jgi:hypothetical protein
VAVKQVRVSDLSGRQAGEEQFAKLIIHEHPQYQGPITLDVLPEELGELPDSEQYVSIEIIQPGERSGQRALLSVDQFNKLAASGDMNAILMNAVAARQPQQPPQSRRRGRGTADSQAPGRRTVEWGAAASWAHLARGGGLRPRAPGRGTAAAGSAWRAAAGPGRSQDQRALRPVKRPNLAAAAPMTK